LRALLRQCRFGRQKIADAIAEQAKNSPIIMPMSGMAPSLDHLAKMIIDRAPKGMSRVYFGLSGPTQTDQHQADLVLQQRPVTPEKKKIISRWRGYHGSGVMTGSLTGWSCSTNAFDLRAPPVLHTEAPYYFRAPTGR